MKRIDHTEPGPNIAAISLMLYLLVAVLSMMAAYEAGKSPDELRNCIACNIQANQTSPGKGGGGDDADGVILLSVHHAEFWLSSTVTAPSASDRFRLPLPERGFDARGPPGLASPVV